MRLENVKYLKLCGEAVEMVFNRTKTQFRFPVRDIEQPPYAIGDIIGIKEAWAKVEDVYFYRVSGVLPNWTNETWRSSVCMPEEAVRIFLKVENVEVQHLKDITVDEVDMEGIWKYGSMFPILTFANAWDKSLSVKKRDEYGWDKNPLVWVVTFRRMDEQECSEEYE